MNTSKLPESFGLYLPLFLQYILECPINRHGEFVSHEQVASKLEEDIITIQNGIGLFNDERFSCGPYGSTAMLSIVVSKILHNLPIIIVITIIALMIPLNCADDSGEF